jgi:hypothetical protein
MVSVFWAGFYGDGNYHTILAHPVFGALWHKSKSVGDRLRAISILFLSFSLPFSLSLSFSLSRPLFLPPTYPIPIQSFTFVLLCRQTPSPIFRERERDREKERETHRVRGCIFSLLTFVTSSYIVILTYTNMDNGFNRFFYGIIWTIHNYVKVNAFCYTAIPSQWHANFPH